jgi:hypothetical protein
MTQQGLGSVGAMSERERRLGLNEAVFREVNERISQVNETFESNVPSEWQMPELDLICECGDSSCVERISMPIDAYEQVRADSRQFVIVPGHEDRAVEVVVAHEKTYDLVRKRPGEAAAVAEETDSRDH